MTLYRAKHTRTRKLPWGEIIFNDKYHITVKTSQYTIIFHRYGAPSGDYYNDWRVFRQQLIDRDLPSIYAVYRYANAHEITSFVKEAGVARGVDSKIQWRENR